MTIRLYFYMLERLRISALRHFKCACLLTTCFRVSTVFFE